MARGTATMFNEALLDGFSKVHDLPNDTLKLAIVDNTITPTAADATPRWADYSANEVSTAGGYPSGGITLTNVSLSVISGVVTLEADDAGLPMDPLGFTDGYYGVLVNTSASNSECIGFIDMGGPVSEQAAPVVFEFPDGVVGEWRANA